MATATKARTSFDVQCPRCMGEDGTVRIDLNSMECICSQCDAEFSVGEAVELASETLRKWEAVRRWVGMIPAALEG